ncbi:aldehyde dehydrogenase [Gordonia jinhuaensis]|uniref:Aldehyde dehydrogenase n=1 Tax=Gordonia jinhuaensis TaxID=1517702 RepID=A0A916T1G7_9ACTN|nr:aldehyde dehydrogenase family protein [Gordonia jinhuaensis]GGB27912.1 aldehyde dehydrogenase [Gordonia jinhuaensis]
MSTIPDAPIDWHARARSIKFPHLAFIDGAAVAARSGETFASVNPATGDVLAEVASCDAADVDAAVAAARRAFPGWSATSAFDRGRILCRLADLIERDVEELALLESLDSGKPVADALGGDVPGTAAVFRYYGEAIDKIPGELPPTADGSIALVTREPLGVVGAVVPWNFPLDIAGWKVAPALAAGNTVVLKPAEETPFTALKLAELACEAGLPDGVLNVVPGLGHTAGQALGRHPDVDCVAFTGSTEVGKMFLSYSGESNMKQIWLECGGKSPNVVFADADLDAAAQKAAFGIFANQGEICSANSRLLVQRSVLDEFLELLCSAAADYAPGDPLDPGSGAGALVSDKHMTRVLEYIDIARKEGRIFLGGNRIGDVGCFVEPTVVVDTGRDARVVREEIFGPVLVVLAFDTEEEAIEIANDTEFGLAASVWTTDINRALRMSKSLRAGTVSINTVDALSPGTPFGGFGASGFGSDLSLRALDKFTGSKTTWISVSGTAS